MAAYASSRLQPAIAGLSPLGNLDRVARGSDRDAAGAILDALIDQLAERVAQRLGAAGPPSTKCDLWRSGRLVRLTACR